MGDSLRRVPDETESSLVIDAPRAAVMAVIADVPAYPDWNDEVRSVEVLTAAADGRPTTARFVLDAGAIKDTYTLAYAWQGDERVSWSMVGDATVLRQLDGSYTLRPEGDDRTTVTYRLQADVRIPMIGLMKRKVEKVIVDRALKGLQQRVEFLRSDER